FKPLVCQNWPMYLNDEDQITFMHLDSGFIRKNCHYTLEQENTFEEELKIKKKLREFKYNHYDSFDLSNKIREKNKNITFSNYINEIEKITNNKNKIISDIIELIKLEIEVKNIKLIFEDKKSSKLEINLLVERSNNKESLKLESLIKKLSLYNLLKASDSNITLEKEDFLISINFSNEYKTYNNQKIIYGSDEIKNNIILNNIHFNKEIVLETLKSCLIIIKYYIKTNNINELERVILNINTLKNIFNEEDDLKYYFDLIYTEELKIKESNKDLILGFINKCISNYPNKSFKFELLKLSLLEDKKDFNDFIQQIIIKYKNNLNKLKKLFLNLKENNNIYFSNEILESIKFLSQNLVENKEYNILIKIIEKYISNLNLNNDSYNIFYWLGISYLRISDYKKALDIFKNLKNNFPRNLELLISIGDELYEEELYNETVEYLSLALNLITYKSNPQEFNIICEILLEILIKTAQTSKANKILDTWKKANIKEYDKILFIKLSEIKLSNSKNKDKLLTQLFNNTEYSYFEFYILSKINNKLITLPININLLREKIHNNKLDSKINKNITIQIINKSQELFSLSAKSNFLSDIFKLENNLKLLIIKSFIYEEIKDYKKALNELDKFNGLYNKKILKNNDIYIYILFLRALINEKESEYDKALEIYNEINKIDNNSKLKPLIEIILSNIILKSKIDSEDFKLFEKDIKLLIESLDKNTKIK
ncbi:MAG: tetratricopeptide repeat protein, partial [Candidatus Sericytochromatia bacterium]